MTPHPHVFLQEAPGHAHTGRPANAGKTRQTPGKNPGKRGVRRCREMVIGFSETKVGEVAHVSDGPRQHKAPALRGVRCERDWLRIVDEV